MVLPTLGSRTAKEQNSYSALPYGEAHCDEHVRLCVCVSVREYISETTRPIFITKFPRMLFQTAGAEHR